MNRKPLSHFDKSLLAALIFALLLAWAVVPAASKDKPGKDPDKPAQQDHGKGNGNGNQGNGNQGGNQGGDHGNKGGNADQPEQQPAPTAAPSTSSQLGCQKNNPGRLDCSSLSVSGVCQENVAVFTIVNDGEPGNGDMRAPTQYRIVQDGVVVQTGSVQLGGKQSMQITWSGGGTVTLEADQQVGHPGKSHPRVTLDCGPQQSTAVPTPTVAPSQTPTEIAFSLAADAYCLPDGSAVFTVTNNGGDMTSAIGYVITDAASNTLYESTVMLTAGQQVAFTYPPDSGATTINVGNGLAIATIDCGPAPTSEPTAEPTSEPTVEPTVDVTPTQEVTPPVDSSLSVSSECTSDGSVIFTVTNNGGDMTAPVGYTVTDAYGTLIEEGQLQLGAGANASYQFYSDGIEYTFNVDGGLAVASGYCVTGTPPPTPEVTPTTPSLSASGVCDVSGIIFTITNNGVDMTEPADYIVVTPDAQLVDQGSVQLASGQSQTLSYPASYGTLTLKVGDFLTFSSVQCVPPTPEPTSEPTVEPTSEPTVEPTAQVTPEPTVEVTPTDTPTPIPTEPLGCQKNNTGRLDCSSLQVSGVCQGGEAVFTITNMGKPGEGDMRAPTAYTIYQNGQPVQTGSVQLQGRESVQITYSGTGTVTLVATQQVGHPGKSQPQATLTCSK